MPRRSLLYVKIVQGECRTNVHSILLSIKEMENKMEGNRVKAFYFIVSSPPVVRNSIVPRCFLRALRYTRIETDHVIMHNL